MMVLTNSGKFRGERRDIGCNKVRSANSETKFVEDFTKGFY